MDSENSAGVPIFLFGLERCRWLRRTFVKMNMVLEVGFFFLIRKTLHYFYRIYPGFIS